MSMIANPEQIVKGQMIEAHTKTLPEQWAEKKRRAEAMAKRMHKHSELYSRAIRMEHCGEIAAAKMCPKCGVVHYISAGLCRDRLCPLCQWRLSRKRYGELLRCFDLLHDDMIANDVHASMLTLTLRNCQAWNLSKTLHSITDAWRECARRAAIKNLYGWARNIEVTYNAESKTYHPHMHVMLLWRGEDEATAAAAAVHTVEEWRRQLKLSYRPIWDYRQAYAKHIDDDTETQSVALDMRTQYDNATVSAAKECSKYILKLDDLEYAPDCDLPTVSAAIKGVRFVGYGGKLKQARAILGMKDTETTEDEEHPQQCRDCGSDLKTAILVWAGGGYAYAE